MKHLIAIGLALHALPVAATEVPLGHAEAVNAFMTYAMQKHVCDASQIPADDQIQDLMTALDKVAIAKGIDTKKAWDDAQSRLKSDPEIANIMTMTPLLAASSASDRRKLFNYCFQLRGIIRSALAPFRPDPLNKKDF